MASTINGGVGRSGSPMPRLITSAPAARLAALEYARANARLRRRAELGIPGHVGAVREGRIAFDRWTHRGQIQRLELLERAQLDGALRVADRDVAKAPHAPLGGALLGALRAL